VVRRDEVDPLFRPVIDAYAQLEPDDTDTWNPLGDEVELNHRLQLQQRLTLALRESGVDVERLRVLDVGCGTGRSSRMYLDVGVMPEQIVGVDLRAGALSRARRAHRGIRYQQYSGSRLPLNDAGSSWVSLCTVMSSVPPGEARIRIADEVHRVLSPDGFLFYWDLVTANPFAGGDALEVGELFPRLDLVSTRAVRVMGLLERENEPGTIGARVAPAGATHVAALLRRTA